MPSLVPSGLVQDKTLTGDQRLTASLAAIRAQIAALSGTTLIKPQAFGAVANSPAAATANRAALQAWLDAADTGILWHDFRQVFHVDTSATPLYVRKKAMIHWLRLKPVIQAGGNQALLEFSPTYGAAVALATGQAVTKGMRVLNLPPLAALPAVGTKVLVQAGQDAYVAAQAGWQTVATVVETDNSNPLQPKVTLDRSAPRAWGAPTPISGATAQLLPITSDAGQGSIINFLEIDERGQANTLGNSLRLTATRDVFIRRYSHHGARAQTVRFDTASEDCRIADYYNRLPLTRAGGGIGFHKDRNNRVDFSKTDTKFDHVAFTQSGYSFGASCERVDLHKYGTTAWGSALISSTDESSPMSLGLVNAIDDLDAGFRLAVQSNGAKAPDVRLFLLDKDPLHLGCLPGLVRTKSIEGKLSVLQKEFVFPATTGVFDKDYFLARMWFPRVEFNADDFTGFDVNLFTPPYVGAGAGRGSLKYQYEVAESAGNESAVGAWTTWLDETNTAQNGSIANGQAFNTSAADTERWLRFSTLAAVAAGKTVRLKLAGYPMKSLYVAGNT